MNATRATPAELAHTKEYHRYILPSSVGLRALRGLYSFSRDLIIIHTVPSLRLETPLEDGSDEFEAPSAVSVFKMIVESFLDVN